MKRVLVSLLFALVGADCSRGRHESEPLTPQQALASFQLDPGFRIELYAAEPHVVDPVEVVWDENGLAYAAEMRDYPEDPSPGKPARSRIRVLEDADGDGRIDRATIFADGLLQLTSLLPWKGGLIVCAAPDILYLKDTDGDRRADVRRVLFTGFAIVNPESRITNLRFAIDNWIYASNNGQRGEIRDPERPDGKPVSVLGADFRFRLDRGEFEAESGPTQFGQAMDDWGRRFITDNTVHVRHVVIPRRYLARNPYLAAGQAVEDISDHGRPTGRMFPLTKPQRWREARTRMRQERYREQGLDQVRPLNPSTEIAGGFFTAAAGGTIYAGDTFPEAYRGNYFVGDVSGNLIHRDIVRPDGVSFRASRPAELQEREFLASTDPWFRPCNFATGPDGNLYVTDMYREFIETPESIPEELKKDMDYWSGDRMGRIYRIVPKSAPSLRAPHLALSRAASAELVGLLEHPNGWWRLTAQRLILEREDRAATPRLAEMTERGKTPQARLHALYGLEGLEALDAATVRGRLTDPEPGVREHAVRLAERFPELGDAVAALAEDPSPKVRLQVALSLGEFLARPGHHQQFLDTLAGLAARHGSDPWFRIAILTSVPESSVTLLHALVRGRRFFGEPTPDRTRFLSELASVVGVRRDAAEVGRFVRALGSASALAAESWQVAALEGLARGLRLAGAARLRIGSAEAVIAKRLSSPSENVQTAARSVARHLELRALLELARREALDPGLAPAKRQVAIAALAGASLAEVRPIFEQILDREKDAELLRTAIRALGSFEDPAVPEILVSRWKSFGPAARMATLGALLDRQSSIVSVLAAVEAGRIDASAFDLPQREKLLQNPDGEVAARARRLFREAGGDRQRVVDSYRAALEEPADAVRGGAVFEKNCAVCHLARRGRRTGPDLSGVSSRTREQLLEDILNPSRAIPPSYTNYLVETHDGRLLDGLIVAETPGTLTLRRSEGEDEVLLRPNIKSIRPSSLSLMPDGFEQSISKQEIADLIAFLQAANVRPAK
jgi:putative membrane-bound dehydrogenase-like protein